MNFKKIADTSFKFHGQSSGIFFLVFEKKKRNAKYLVSKTKYDTAI